MKVQSWPALLATVFVGGPILIFRIKDAIFGDIIDYVWCVFILYIVIKGFYVSLSKEGYEEDQRRTARGKRVYRKLFGRFAPVMPYGAIVLILSAWALLMLFPSRKWLCVLFIVLAIAYSIWLSIVFRKHMEIEKEREGEADAGKI
jgi:small-conductance mechanosensitive channel